MLGQGWNFWQEKKEKKIPENVIACFGNNWCDLTK